jgi:hypothetical protein
VGPSRRRSTLALGAAIAALTVAAATAPGAQAIVGGRPDGDDHPAVGMMAIEHDGIRDAWCSSWYAGPHKADPGTGVLVTAGHCLADLAELGYAPSDITVTFDSGAHFEWNESESVAVAVGTDWHPAFAYDFVLSDDEDYGVVLLEDPVPGLAGLRFPAAHLLDDSAARGALTGSLFDSVGYGWMAHFKRGPVSYEEPPGRMFSVSRYAGLTKTELGLLANPDAGYGGGCYGDSGGPVLPHGTDTVVGMTNGGDPLCRAKVTPNRLDIPGARAFFGDHVNLP